MNDKLLKGIKCPHCNSDGPFYIESKMLTLIWDDGVDEKDIDTKPERDNDSYCSCFACDFEGSVGEFRDMRHTALGWKERE